MAREVAALVSSHTEELELDLEAGQLGRGSAPAPDRQPGLGGGGVSSQARGPACPPHRAASSPGHCDICPVSRPQTAAQSHVSTSTGEPGNWLWLLGDERPGFALLSLSFPCLCVRGWVSGGALGTGSKENEVASWVDRVQTFPRSRVLGMPCTAKTPPPAPQSTGARWSFGKVCVCVGGGGVVSALCPGPHPGWLRPEITGASRKIISICLGHSKVGLLSLHPPETARTPI